jgi:DNA-binding protein H-NS
MAERVIWERIVDQDKIRERSERFRKRFFPSAGSILLIVLILAGWKNATSAATARSNSARPSSAWTYLEPDENRTWSNSAGRT